MIGTKKKGNPNNEVANCKPGDIVMAREPNQLVIGKLKELNYPAVYIIGSAETFSENTIYKYSHERIKHMGLPITDEKVKEIIASGEAIVFQAE